MTNRTRALIAVLLLLPILLFVGLRTWQHAAGQSPSPSGTESRRTPDPPLDQPAPRSHPPAGGVADTDMDALPADVALLLARAEAGDARAACSLAVRLQPCPKADFFTDQMMDGLRDAEAKAVAEGNVQEAEQPAVFLLSGTRIRQQCDGIPASLHRRAFDLLRQAALAGEPEAIIRYARGFALPDGSTFGFIRTSRFDTWRREALPMLQARIEAGHPEAVLVMLEARGGFSYLGLVTPPDPMLDQAYRVLARRLFGEHPSLRRFVDVPGLTPDQRLEAEHLADEWHRVRFVGQELKLEESLVGLMEPHDLADPHGWPRPTRVQPPCGGTPKEGSP